jgi:hypothetical protein
MGTDAQRIRADIVETRERMSDTVDALGYKTDVKARARDYVGERRAAVSGSVGGAMRRVGGAADAVVSRFTGSTEQAGGGPAAGAREAISNAGGAISGTAERSPVAVAVAGVGVGLLVGLMLPSTTVEDERIGPVADEVKDRARETGQEALEHGKELAQEALDRGTDAAHDVARSVSEGGREHARELAESAKEHGREAASHVQAQDRRAAGDLPPT